jgi:hypothetical protein
MTEAQQQSQNGDHKIELEKYLSEDGEHIISEVKLNDSLRNLIKEFCILDETVEESMDGMCAIDKVKRYKIKSVIRNSYTWYKLHAFFFTKEAVDGGSVKVKFSDTRKFRDFLDSLRYFREVIKTMEELKRNEKISIIYKVER